FSTRAAVSAVRLHGAQKALLKPCRSAAPLSRHSYKFGFCLVRCARLAQFAPCRPCPAPEHTLSPASGPQVSHGRFLKPAIRWHRATPVSPGHAAQAPRKVWNLSLFPPISASNQSLPPPVI